MIRIVIHKEFYINIKNLVIFIKDNYPVFKDSDVYNYFINNEEGIIDTYLNWETDYNSFIDTADINYKAIEKELYNYLFK